MFESSTLFASLIWGGIGSGFFIYGMKQRALVPFIGGTAMVGLSYCVASAWYMSLGSIALLAAMIWAIREGY